VKDGVDGVVAIPAIDCDFAELTSRAVCANVRWQMGFDRKIGPLKALQGLMWEMGYQNGELKGR
jgi:enolase-phosphatase E1